MPKLNYQYQVLSGTSFGKAIRVLESSDIWSLRPILDTLYLLICGIALAIICVGFANNKL